MERKDITQRDVDEYLTGSTTVKALATKLGMHEVTLSKKLKKLGVSIVAVHPVGKKYLCNETFFKEIDSEKKAYWLGFIFAEGWLSESVDKRTGCVGIRFGMEIGRKDITHLERFKADVESTAPIIERVRNGKTKLVELCYLRIGGPRFCTHFLKYFSPGKKSDKLIFPEMPRELHPHFVRGYFDGDGCIVKNGVLSFTSNSLPFLKQLNALFLTEIPGYIPVSKFHKYKKKKTWKYVHGKCKARCVYDYMYGESTLKLDRKYQIYCQVFGLGQ